MSTTVARTQVKITAGGSLKLLEGVTAQSGGPGGSKAASDITPINATASTFCDGRPVYDPIKMSCTWDADDPSHVAVLAAVQSDAPTVDPCEIGTTLSTTPGLAFSGYIDEFGLTIPNEGPVIMTTGISITSPITKGANTAVTPSITFSPEVGQGAQLKLYVTAAYVKITGVENIAFAGLVREKVPGTPIDSMAPVTVPGTRQHGNLTFDLLYDTADANHVLLDTAFHAVNQVDKFQVAFADAKTITTDGVVNGWAITVGARNAPNRVKVTVRLTSNLVVA